MKLSSNEHDATVGDILDLITDVQRDTVATIQDRIGIALSCHPSMSEGHARASVLTGVVCGVVDVVAATMDRASALMFVQSIVDYWNDKASRREPNHDENTGPTN